VSNVVQFYANVKWFNVSDQPNDFRDLPPEFSTAFRLWKESPDENSEKICNLLAPFVKARLVFCNIENWEDLFLEQNSASAGEVEAKITKIVGVSFECSPIPTCKAEALFDVQVNDVFFETDIDEWQSENGPLTDTVIFYWDIQRVRETEDLDFTGADNLGIEIVRADFTNL
jgi:hypothetical protein